IHSGRLDIPGRAGCPRSPLRGRAAGRECPRAEREDRSGQLPRRRHLGGGSVRGDRQDARGFMTPDLSARLAVIDTSCLCDARRGIRVLDPGLRPLAPGLRMAGPACTVSCRNDFLGVLEALRQAEPGEVLVVDAGGEPLAVAGELFATEARRKGLAGIVVDGAVRDVATIRALGLPVYARSICPAAGTVSALGAFNQPIRCGGVEIIQGDIVIGD